MAYATIEEYDVLLEQLGTDLANDDSQTRTEEEVEAKKQALLDRASEDIDGALASRRVDPYVTPVAETATASRAILRPLCLKRALEWGMAIRKQEIPPTNTEIEKYRDGQANLPDAPLLTVTVVESETSDGWYSDSPVYAGRSAFLG